MMASMRCKKMAVCPVCDGKGDGKIECTKCGGEGKIYQSLLLEKELLCTRCGASGEIICPDYEEEN